MASKNINNKNKALNKRMSLPEGVPNVDFGNDPYIIKKNEQAKAVLRRVGFPKDLVNKK
jgi:hypothetical protein